MHSYDTIVTKNKGKKTVAACNKGSLGQAFTESLILFYFFFCNCKLKDCNVTSKVMSVTSYGRCMRNGHERNHRREPVEGKNYREYTQ